MYINFVIIAEHISSESRLYSQKVRMYVRGGPRSEMSCGMSLHTVSIGIGHMSDIMCGRRRSLAMEMELGVAAGPLRPVYYNYSEP